MAFPALRTGEPQYLSQVIAVLRQRGIVDKRNKTTVWFAQWASAFQLLPYPVPHQVVYKKPNAAAHPPAAQHAALVPEALPPDAPARGMPPVLPPPQCFSAGPGLPDEVVRILKAIPDLRHQPQMLSHVVPVLRQKTILGQSAKSTAFFARHAAHFKLMPAHQPMQLAYIEPGLALGGC